jgi:UDP-3-O-[3-hydroxymyristoyl] glucosamine N-acyltransferase
MEFTAKQISGLIGGKIEGDENTTITTVAKIEDGKKGSICFLANPVYNHFLYTTDASLVLISNAFVLEKPVKSSCTLIRVEDPYSSFAKLLVIYSDMRKPIKKGIEQPSFIATNATYGNDCYIGAFAYLGENVKIGNNVKIYPHCYIGDNVTIADNSIIYSGVKIYHDCVIGKNCTIHASSVIGSDGFGFAPSAANNYEKIPQIGNVVLEDDVEIGSNTSIDRATMGSTRIGKGVKIDNLVQIGHNVEIGENTVLAGASSIAGSTKVGKNVMMAGQTGLIGHIKIADGVKIAGQSGIGASITQEGAIVQGSPAFSIHDYQRSYVLFRGLPKLSDRIRTLEKQMKEIKADHEDKFRL